MTMLGSATMPRKIVSHEIDASVYVIDDEWIQRKALGDLFRSVGLRSELFPTTSAFLEAELDDLPSCLVLDVRLPGMSGLEFQEQLRQMERQLPLVFITGFADVSMSVRAMKGGAVDFLTKPVHDQDLLDAVHCALEVDRARRVHRRSLERLICLYEKLSEREKQVMALVSTGLMNKQIAGRLGLSDVTVKIHRGQVMRKMEVRSVPDLVRINDRLAQTSFWRGAG